MTNLEKYTQIFCDTFEVDAAVVKEYAYEQTKGWDSVGHMSLIAAIEEEFDIELEPTEILQINSFYAGIDILRTKGIEL